MTKSPFFSITLFITSISGTVKNSLRNLFAKCRGFFNSIFKPKKEQAKVVINPHTKKLDPAQLQKLATLLNVNPNMESEVSESIKSIIHSNKDSVKSQIKNKIALNQEIENFNRATLRKQIVHIVSDSKKPFLPKIHSYIIIGRATKTHQKGYGDVLYCGGSIMHQSYKVTNSILKSVNRSKALSPSTKAAVHNLKYQEFPSAEHFLRALLIEKAKLTKQPISQEDLYEQAASPDKELQQLIYFQSSGLNHGKQGAVLPLNPNTGARVFDRKQFEAGKSANKIYPNIDPMIVRDLYRQQQLFAYYMDEKAGIGKDIEFKTKLNTNESQTSRIMKSLVKFTFLPKPNNAFTANCNKATATLLQEAENLSATKQKRKPETINTASLWGIAAKQRMYLWNPLKQSIKAIVHNLIDKDQIGQATTMNLETLSKRKRDIFTVICTLPLTDQEKALKQALDLDENKKGNALSQIFNQKDYRPGFYQLKRLQNLPYLHKLKQRLNVVRSEINQSKQSDESCDALTEQVQPTMSSS